MSLPIKPFKYFESPDGEDVYRKLVHVMKPTAGLATGLAISDVMLVTHPKGYLSTIGRMGYVASPFLAAGAAFVLGSNGVASIRKKQDKWNWFAGGLLSGSVFGIWQRRFSLGFHLGVVMGAFAVLNKHLKEQGMELVNWDAPISHMVIWDPDWTLTKERKRNWVTSPDDAQ